ncbi:hypothetical protein EDF68_101992 [Ochrobactrum sp. BH3]|nr:hypothetical protein EDF68_101992 [Ochrobactrum sp. BH3]
MQKFRKKPVVIEAIKYNGTIGTANYILSWIGDHGAKAKRAHNTKPEAGIVINTLEGDMTAVPGDWIIKGIKGEFYPCKPDIFTATYDPVVEEDEFTCIGCGNVIRDGELVFHEHGEGGLIHAECLGSDRESYCNDDGEPLGPDDPLPAPFPYVRAEYFPTAGQKGDTAFIGEQWVECWYGSAPGKGASVWSQTANGTHKNMLFHVGPDKAHLELARTIVAAHNASQHAVDPAQDDAESGTHE